MLYTLRTGKTIELTFEQWDKMTDEDEEYLVAYGHGEEIESPWRQSMLEKPDNILDELKELPDISIDEKLSDKEFIEED